MFELSRLLGLQASNDGKERCLVGITQSTWWHRIVCIIDSAQNLVLLVNPILRVRAAQLKSSARTRTGVATRAFFCGC